MNLLMKKVAFYLFAAMVIGTGFIALADWETGGPHKMHWAQEPDLTPDGIDVNATLPRYILADDFECSASGLVTRIHIWGSWFDDAMDPGAVFTLSIHEDDPPHAGRPYPQPGVVVWSGVFPPPAYVQQLYFQIPEGWMDPPDMFIPEADVNCWQYNFAIDPFDAFLQEERTVYWLSVQAESPEMFLFGWKTAQPDLRWREDAMWAEIPPVWESLFYPPQHPRFPESLDLAFVIDGDPPPTEDWGDAPDPTYPTLAAQNGARHTVVPGVHLGLRVDVEPNGQPHPSALGDDLGGQDDEDGITFLTPLLPGQYATVEIVNSVGGVVNAWIDFDADGGWAEAKDHIFSAGLPSGTNTVAFMVPPDAVPGTVTFARFRFSVSGVASFTGPAPDGEVEDYQVVIELDPDRKWVQLPDPALPGLHAHDWQTPQGPYLFTVLADDWQCHGGLVTDVHWWGNYELDPTGGELRGAGIDHFHLSIHVPDGQDPCLPGPEVYGIDIPFLDLFELNTGLINVEGSPIYRYDYVLGEPFEQVAGNHYFLDITAVSIDPFNPPSWRWQEAGRSADPVLCGAAEYSNASSAWQTIEWPGPPTMYSDLAFEITSATFLPPVADADGPYVGDEGTAVTLDGTGSYDPDGTLVDYEWDLDEDGAYDDATGAIVSYTWYDNGLYQPALRVTDNTGLTDTDTASVTIRNVAPALSGLAATPTDEGGFSTLTGTITDPGTDDSFNLAVDWGDGSPPVFYPYPAGSTAFSESHPYLDDNPTVTTADTYAITVTLSDDDGGVDVDITFVTVSNVPPALAGVTASGVSEGGFSTLSGFIVDPGVLDSFTLEVNWGDGTPVNTYNYPAGWTSFGEKHLYLDDDPSGTTTDVYSITVTLSDDDSGTDTWGPMVTVSNVPPALSGVFATPCNEGGTSTLSGNLSDPGLPDTFTLRVDWGDGSPIEVFPYPAGTLGILESHPYTASAVYPVTVTVEDDDTGSNTVLTAVNVSNLPPVADANGPYTGPVGEDIMLDGTGSWDPGDDIVAYEWDLDGDGVYNDALGPAPTFRPTTVGLLGIGLKVTDDDGAFDTATALVDVGLPTPCPKWAQWPDCDHGLDVESWYTIPPLGIPEPIVADDWLCDGRPLVGIVWWGSYIGWMEEIPEPDIPPPGGPDRPVEFSVAWYTDIPATPESHSQPGDLLESRVYRLADYYNPTPPIPGMVVEEPECVVELDYIAPGLFEHVYRYTLWFEPGEEFNEKEGTVYWLSIRAGYDSIQPLPPWLWGWTTTRPAWNWNDDAVLTIDPPTWHEMFYPPPPWEWVPDHPYQDESVNMSFLLLTDVCPSRCKKWDQEPDMVQGVNMISSRLEDGPGPVHADDFVSDGRAITDIHWWGSYIGWWADVPGGPFPGIRPPTGYPHPLGFELIWHSQDPAISCMPGIPLAFVFVPMSRCHETYYGTVTGALPEVLFEHEYQYYVDLLDPRLEEAGPWLEEESEPYWLSIQAVFSTNWIVGTDHDGWGWKTSPDLQACAALSSPDGVVWTPGRMPPGHPLEGAPFDLSFELTTTNLDQTAVIGIEEVTEPGPVFLVSTGYCGCGVMILQHTTNVLGHIVWEDLLTNVVPRAINVWETPATPDERRYFRIKAAGQ